MSDRNIFGQPVILSSSKPNWADLAIERAAEIERLRAEVAEWRRAADHNARIVADQRDQLVKLGAEIERLRAALREIRALHQPEWASEQAKAAGKEPWVCELCGTADGHWPCATIDTIREVLGDE